ncbi:RNA polymerase sigma factor [Leifsonia shinshuensis]|uniref:RNA polymerase sigma-70 factor (ECF subfamily) n=1 Tax=Leifsonia shinshuensis TaxID=150026 RepID=A0A853CPL9_9MICO|nr:RNA polymerase sigma factor [Leifsonia shinshuensis]NYJ22259.1 RNA polymerase sigma-70 factor (ECF subfamily) [Leifsonia shinshuensis]
MNEPQTDEWLLQRAIDGDGDAFADLFRRHRDRLFRHVLRLVAAPADAEDIVGLAFAEAWRKRRSVTFIDASLLPWLLVTGANLARNSSRARRRHDALLARLPQPAVVPDPAIEVVDRVHGSEVSARVRESFDRLSERDRQILSLCVLEELSTADAAAILRVPAGTVKSRLSRARRRLADLITHDGGLEELRSLR